MSEIEYLPPAKPLNNHQFRQLPLFNMKPEDAGRYPRGYTPERMHDVDQSLGSVGVSPDSDHPWIPKNADVVGRRTAARHKVVDTLARSTTPTEELRAGQVVDRTPRWNGTTREPTKILPPSVRFEGPSSSAGSYGTYMSGGTRSEPERTAAPTVNNHPGASYDPDYVLMHEFGHHRSQVEGTKHSDQGSTWAHTVKGEVKPSVRAKEEAFADRSAAERLVRPRGDLRPTTRSQDYAGSGYFSDRKQQDRFGDSYRNAYPERHIVHNRQQLAQAKGERITPAEAMDERHNVTWRPLGPIEKGWREAARHVDQPHLFMRNAESIETAAQPDFGQFGYQTQHGNDENIAKHGPDLPTMTTGRGVAGAEEQHGIDLSPGTVGRDQWTSRGTFNGGKVNKAQFHKSFGERFGINAATRREMMRRP